MQKSFLKITVIQSNIVWHNAVENRKIFSEKISLINHETDVIILPEMFTTGFTMQPEEVAEEMHGETTKWMQQMAFKKNAAICGSVVILENNRYYNRFLFVHPSGEIDYYNKRHLFTLAGEHEVYVAGLQKKIVEYKGWKICPIICYDLRFPVWARNIEDYDVLIVVANWPSPRILAWDTLLQARAIENMCYVIGVNRVGIDANNLEYNGHSAVFNSLGNQILKLIENQEFSETFVLRREHLEETRNKLNFLADKDNFVIK